MTIAIAPTVGRVVWFHPASNSTHHAFASNAICAAIVANVLPNGRLNLGVFDSCGASHSMENVPLIQDDEQVPRDGYYAEWMPYQKEQAAKTKATVTAAAENQQTSPFSDAAIPVQP